MAQRKKLIIGNWKMNFSVHESSVYLHKLQALMRAHRDVQVVVAPTMLCIQPLSLQIDRQKVRLAAQNFYWRDYGAFTGEVSATQLRGLVEYALIGHSERRHVFRETNKDTREKVQAALRNDITPVLCIGETSQERAAGETRDALQDQLAAGLTNVTSEDLERVVIAYEPVWAIGTGDNATPQDVAKAVVMIRRHIRHLFGDAASKTVRVLYGGSVTSANAADYMMTPGVDGLLIGGASLKLHEFTYIIDKARTS
jgi:triosephosphate isomerase